MIFASPEDSKKNLKAKIKFKPSQKLFKGRTLRSPAISVKDE